MMEFIFKLLCNIVCGMCFSWGGTSFIEERRFTMPVILSFLILLMTWKWYIAYILGALLLAGFGYNWTQKYGDFIFGSWLGLIVWFIGKGL